MNGWTLKWPNMTMPMSNYNLKTNPKSLFLDSFDQGFQKVHTQLICGICTFWTEALNHSISILIRHFHFGEIVG